MQRISQQHPPLDTADPQIGNLVQALLWAFFRPELSFRARFSPFCEVILVQVFLRR
jgi:hypothetical protein